jgi:hypothetical protein
MHPLSNNILSLTTNKFKNHFSTQIIDDRRGNSIMSNKNSKLKSIRVIRNNETPLLSHLFGTHKFHSDSNLNIITKR